jgi:ferredoxin
MYINAEECVDCGACRLLCEVDAIFYEDDLPDSERKFLADNAAFFTEVLPGREAPLGTPGGASGLGAVGVDTPMVTGLPRA